MKDCGWQVARGLHATPQPAKRNMIVPDNRQVLVIGLGGRGRAACELLCRSGAKVVGLDFADTPDLREGATALRRLGVEVMLGAATPPERNFSLAVLSPGVPANNPIVQAVRRSDLPVIGDLELGFRQARCLSIAIAGTNGKGTTAGLVERILTNNHRRTLVCGHGARPVCSVVGQTEELDFLILQASVFQLEMTELFQPALALLLNLAPDHSDRYPRPADYVRATARLFRNQQPFDWAIAQSEALAQLCESRLPVPAKTITFSATDPAADLFLNRSLILSRIPNWSGPLLNMDHCQLRGPHNAENLMAALAVGHALGLPLGSMVDTLKTCTAGPHRCELAAEINGVQFINDSKAANVNALHKALLSARPGPHGEANVWLIAGRGDSGQDLHEVGPVLSRRVKRAFLVGEASEKTHVAWSLFTPCKVAASLLEAISEAARNAASGDVVLLSPACSSLGQFQNDEERGKVFCEAVKSIGRGGPVGTPNIIGKKVTTY
jgi:UDP-N-acetylmuramoylalanine--D-glutamate ligase